MADAELVLNSEDSNFRRPPAKTDRLFYTKPDSTVIEVEHPKPSRTYREGQCNAHYGVIGSGKLVAKTDKFRFPYAQTHGVRAFDTNIEAVLDSLEGNRNESFIIIRGISDYADGARKEWQPYASLAAAAFMKSLVTSMS